MIQAVIQAVPKLAPRERSPWSHDHGGVRKNAEADLEAAHQALAVWKAQV